MSGGQILSDDQTKAAFNSPRGVKAVKFLVDLVSTWIGLSKSAYGKPRR